MNATFLQNFMVRYNDGFCPDIAKFPKHMRSEERGTRPVDKHFSRSECGGALAIIYAISEHVRIKFQYEKFRSCYIGSAPSNLHTARCSHITFTYEEYEWQVEIQINNTSFKL